LDHALAFPPGCHDHAYSPGQGSGLRLEAPEDLSVIIGLELPLPGGSRMFLQSRIAPGTWYV
jgi:hypothetical protein